VSTKCYRAIEVLEALKVLEVLEVIEVTKFVEVLELSSVIVDDEIPQQSTAVEVRTCLGVVQHYAAPLDLNMHQNI
jgi:hypothetical protein